MKVTEESGQDRELWPRHNWITIQENPAVSRGRILMVGLNSRKFLAGHLTHLVQRLPAVHKILGGSLGSHDSSWGVVPVIPAQKRRRREGKFQFLLSHSKFAANLRPDLRNINKYT